MLRKFTVAKFDVIKHKKVIAFTFSYLLRLEKMIIYYKKANNNNNKTIIIYLFSHPWKEAFKPFFRLNFQQTTYIMFKYKILESEDIALVNFEKFYLKK